MTEANIIETDFCIIGAGSGGLSLAAGAVQMGASVTLIQKGKMGGDCLNYGCVPSKSLLAAAKIGHMKSEEFGWQGTLHPDFAKVSDHIQSVIASIAPHDSVERFTKLGVQVIEGIGQFIDPKTVQVGPQRVKAKKFIIATGSSPIIPAIDGLQGILYLTTDSIFSLQELPKHLVIVGGGPIGIEMAQGYRRLGAQVTVLEAFSILPRDDHEAAAIIRQQLIGEGVDIIEGAQVTKVDYQDPGPFRVYVQHQGKEKTIVGSHLLLAVGRRPQVSLLNLEAANVRYSTKGIEVDQYLRTSNKQIYAIGDVTGHFQFTHVANYQAGVVIRHALLKFTAGAHENNIPWVTYTDPELAHIGLTEAKAVNQKISHKVLRSFYQENDRACTERSTLGFIKVIVAPRGQILGVTIIGAHGGELIFPWILAIQQKLKIGAMANIIAPYPTFSEINKRVAGSYFTPLLYNEWTKKIVRFLLKWT
ncbi:MAG TPA: FAD-dependent oxidoreductase [Candidatus Nitrosotenuis sp.]|nr:FAD-dependent oxidoreductase [Candidatus Nitrosotenuis sp.]